MSEIMNQILAFAGVLGGFEGVKYFINLKTNKRKGEAEADEAKFKVLSETNTYLQEQLKAKEERFAKQIEVARNLNDEVLELTKQKAQVELELQKYKCIVPQCPNRKPQNGF